ncbi:heterodisulfide reductase-related iron-sulfur binding cluster, partial [Streptomyces sp. NPDC058953]|uniref:heterodisulfide reductase-related iron-sulfur binding cluster n=1 Tax=Streptomyces sp. NPDC058953 TaxID=3346676 RepID=UPI003680163F
GPRGTRAPPSHGLPPPRPRPRVARRSHVRCFRRHRRHAPAPGGRGAVTYLADSFTTYTEPEIGRAAIELLERAGWDVRLESRGCCGRSSLSKGLVDDAADKAFKLAHLLTETTPPGSPVVGCEPSCLMTLRDEHRALLPGDSAVADIAGRVAQVEELLVKAIDEGALRLDAESWPAGRRLLYHGHCHQKAEVGTAATVELLRRIPGADVVEVDAGCCGMAGSFGFESEHYEVSLTVGEDRLFPAVRAEGDDTVIVATGVSCRQQIFHGTERTAWHPVQLIRAALAPGSGGVPHPGAASDTTDRAQR